MWAEWQIPVNLLGYTHERVAAVNLYPNLTPETEIKLRAFVAATRKQPEEIVLEALGDQWSAAWMNGLASHNPHVDDTRDRFNPDH